MSKLIHFIRAVKPNNFIWASGLLVMSFTLCLIITQKAAAQGPVNLQIDASNILNPPPVTISSLTLPGCLLSVAANLSVNATDQFNTTTTPPPESPEKPLIGDITMLIKKVNGNTVDLSLGVVPVTLSTQPQPMSQSLLSLLKGQGLVDIQYTINKGSKTYTAGVYTTTLNFVLSGLLCTPAPVTNTLNLRVLPFINPVAPQPLTIQINSFDQFRSSGAAVSQSITHTRTVPMTLQLKGSDPFTFTGSAGIVNPSTSIQKLQARLNMPVMGTYQSLGPGYQNLSGAINLAEPSGNQGSLKIDYNLTPAALVSGFMQAGTYSSSIYTQYSDARSTPSNPAATVNTLTPLTIQIADLQEIKINQSAININFNQLSDYQNGVSVDIPNHLTVSKTNPFDIYVKAQSNTLNNGQNAIPVNCIEIGPVAGQSTIQKVTLSTTAQKIISGEAPCLDKSYSVRYSIPSEKVPSLIGKPPGTYTTTITYSFTAP